MSAARTSLAERDRIGAERQAEVNALAEAGLFDEATITARGYAATDHAEYPQYNGHWHGWVVCKVTQRLRSKGGIQAEAGDWVITRYAPSWAGCGPDVTFYSLRLGWDCSGSTGLDYTRARNAHLSKLQAREFALAAFRNRAVR